MNQSPQPSNTPKSSIKLDFFRHSVKGPTPEEGDHKTRLTPEGQKMAVDSGKQKNVSPEVSLAGGSNRERTHQTALAQLYSSNPDTKDMTLEEMSKLHKDGSKSIRFSDLDFSFDSGDFYDQTALDRYLKTQDLLVFLFEESDTLATKANNMVSTTYSRAAAGIARVVERYIKILPNWDKLVQKNPEKYKSFDNQLRRLFATHGGLSECFLLKTIELSQGREKATEFLNNLPNKNQFDFNQGFSMELERNDENTRIFIASNGFSWTISEDILLKIIQQDERLTNPDFNPEVSAFKI
jgi:hypothetical protein